MFHVSSVRNRDSIQAHGLDWTRMSAAPWIAGGREPEVDGIFLSTDCLTAQFFVRMNNTGGPVDIWAVDGVDPNDLVESGDGFRYLPTRIDRQRLTLADTGLLAEALPPAVEVRSEGGGSSGVYHSYGTVTRDDGTVLHGDAARAYLANRSDDR